MCEAITSQIAAARDKAQKAPELLIEERKPGDKLPVGRGGQRRNRSIMDIVDEAQSGLQIPNK